MEIFGRPETAAETQMEVRIQSTAQTQQNKREKGFLEKQETVESRRKRERQWGAPNITALLLVDTCVCFPRSCWEVTACPVKVYKTQQRELNLSYQKLSPVYATGVMSTQAGKGDSSTTSSSAAARRCTQGTKECLHPEAGTKVYMGGILGSAWEGRCVHPLEPASHKELGVRLLITFGNSQKRFAQSRWMRTARK